MRRAAARAALLVFAACGAEAKDRLGLGELALATTSQACACLHGGGLDVLTGCPVELTARVFDVEGGAPADIDGTRATLRVQTLDAVPRDLLTLDAVIEGGATRFALTPSLATDAEREDFVLALSLAVNHNTTLVRLGQLTPARPGPYVLCTYFAASLGSPLPYAGAVRAGDALTLTTRLVGVLDEPFELGLAMLSNGDAQSLASPSFTTDDERLATLAWTAPASSGEAVSVVLRAGTHAPPEVTAPFDEVDSAPATLLAR